MSSRVLRGIAPALLALAVAPLFAPGCGDDETSAATPAACEALLVAEPCLDCAESSCCEPLRTCLDDGACVECVGGYKSSCTGEAWVALRDCVQSSCSATCDAAQVPAPACDAPATAPSNGSCVQLGGSAACNPITNEGCDDEAGEACDFQGGALSCYPAPNTNAVCTACSLRDGFCAPGTTCVQAVTVGDDGVEVAGACARACCDDGDCGSGVCGRKVTIDGAEVGVCITAPGGAGGAGGTGGTSGSGGAGGGGGASGGGGTGG